ncbi:MAG: glycosyltransferase family 32 protein [Pseudomonadota bacterium]
MALPKSKTFFFWDDLNLIPREYEDNVAIFKAIHSGWDVELYDDARAKNYIERCFPEALSFYNSLVIPAAKSDLFRLIALYNEGGWYLDIDFRVKRHLGFFSSYDNVLFCRDDTDNPRVINGVMFFKDKGSTIIKECIDASIRFFDAGVYRHNVWRLTGPGLLNTFIWSYGLKRDSLFSFYFYFKSPEKTFESIKTKFINSWSYLQSLGVTGTEGFNVERLPAKLSRMELNALLDNPVFKNYFGKNVNSILRHKHPVVETKIFFHVLLSKPLDGVDKDLLISLGKKVSDEKLSLMLNKLEFNK